MEHWTYLQYRAAVENDVDYALSKRRYSSVQAVGYAHNELALRLEERPDEATLALVALATEANRRGVLNQHPIDTPFAIEVSERLLPKFVEEAIRKMSSDEKDVFEQDVTALRRAYSY